MLDNVMNNLSFEFEESWDSELRDKVEFVSDKNKYVINYNNIYPIINIEKL
ncbi:hypothetical protein CBC_A0407 [Clostridium botulinum C str. Eklund]|nr:hypothetical protein CBC_A0407 [Clostridium botulinum C str. Eklund]